MTEVEALDHAITTVETALSEAGMCELAEVALLNGLLLVYGLWGGTGRLYVRSAGGNDEPRLLACVELEFKIAAAARVDGLVKAVVASSAARRNRVHDAAKLFLDAAASVAGQNGRVYR